MVQTSGADISGNFTASKKLFLDTINGYAKVISIAYLNDSTLAAVCLQISRCIIQIRCRRLGFQWRRGTGNMVTAKVAPARDGLLLFPCQAYRRACQTFT